MASMTGARPVGANASMANTQGQMVPPQSMSGQMPTGRPSLPGYKPQMMQPTSSGKQTPETVPVGVMATMLRQAMRRTREQRQEFAPYKPLESQLTPQALPPMEIP